MSLKRTGPLHCAGLLLLVLSMPGAATAADAPGAPRLEANGEILEGTWEGDKGDIAAFKGVPFAAPPVGDLRWRAPQPATPRPGLQEAVEFQPGCMQGPGITQWYADVAVEFGYGPENVGRPNGVSEDCLYLNIWTPAPEAGGGLPVMVWIHGGSNVAGWSYEPNYIGDRLAARGVVVVSAAYRLGPLGFFSHPALDNGPGQPVANFGWLDSVMALKWVRKHIAAFGGDPGNVTVFGESAGAGDIRDFLIAEPVGERLYRRLILQSTAGSLSQRRTLAEERETGRKIIEHLGIEEAQQTPERLRGIPAADLLKGTAESRRGQYHDLVNDGLTLKQHPLDSLGRAALGKVDILIGTNADEWYMYLDEDTSASDLDKWLEDNAPASASVLGPLVSEATDRRRALDRLITAKNYVCPSQYVAARVSAAGGRAWVYFFSRQRPGPGGEKLGAYHGTEIGYVFDRHEYWQSTDEVDDALTEAVMDYWVQFARTGDPNVAGRPVWPQYRVAKPRVMELGNHIGAIPPPDADLCLWLGPRREVRK
jgi:para-nitrobenzyl esterase